MKIVGVLLIVVAMIIGYISDKCINPLWLESFIGLAFCFWLIGIYVLILDNNCPKKGRVPHMRNPPAPPKKCICNDIGKHTPGGRCEAEHSTATPKRYSSNGIEIPEFPKDRIN